MKILTWVVDFTKPGMLHTEYIIGTKGQVLEYVENQIIAYGGKATTPETVTMPKKILWNEKKVNLTMNQ